MVSLAVNIEQLGTISNLSDTAQISFADAETLWIVLDGRVDVFVAARLGSNGLGSRYHFLRVEAGGAFFGLAPSEAMDIFATPALPGTKLFAMPLSLLREMIQAQDEWACALLDDWVKTVGARMRVNKPPAGFLEILADGQVDLGEGSQAVVAIEGIVWVHQMRGQSHLLADTTRPPILAGNYFPLSRQIWLQASSESFIEAVTVAEIAASEAGWSALASFQSLACALLLRERQETIGAGEERIRRKSSFDAVFVDKALHRLITPMRADSPGSDSDNGCQDHLFLAFEAVAKELQIKLTPPLEMLRGEPLADPVAAIAKASAIRMRRIVLKGSWWRANNGPLVCFTQQEQRPFAVLTRSSSSMQLFDPATQKLSVLDEAVAATMNPMAYILYRGFPRKALSVLDLLRFGFGQSKSEGLLIVATGMAAGLLAIVNPYATGILFDRLIPGAERKQLIEMTLFLFVIALTSSMFMLTRAFAILRLQGKMDTTIQAALWDRLLNLPVSFFRDYSAGDLAQRSMGISQIREVLTGSALNALLSGIFSIFSFALLFYYSLKLALVAAVLVLFACLVSVGMGMLQVRFGRTMLRLNGDLSSKLLQFVSGIAKFRVTGTQSRVFAAWARLFSEQKKFSIRARRISRNLNVFITIFPLLSFVAIFYANTVVSGGDARHELSTGEFLAFLAAFTQFLMAALSLSSTLLSVVSIIPIYERARPILTTLPEVTDNKANPGPLTGGIEVSHVSFSYRPELPLVLQDLTLKIKPGEFVAFVGSSGCGKSTLLRLLLGFEHPASGSIYFDGQDLAGLDIQAVRRQIGVVLQSSRLVSGSIFENIAGSLPLTVDDVWKACRMAGIEDDIRQMPMGLHTNINDGGGGVSGGQRQRIMIARAIVSNPCILLFDEATSALDNHTQGVVTRSLAGLQATRIVIAHRLSTVIGADKIFVFDRGRVVESGTYAELIEVPGIFQTLAKRQMT